MARSSTHRRTAPAVLHDRELRAAVQSDACVLLTGEREAVETLAYRIHSLSAWRHGPFAVIDCGGSEELVRSRLFNEHDPVATLRPRPDRRKCGGTVLLYDVAKLSSTFQAMLAEFLSEIRAENDRNGSGRRVIASTPEPLWPRVEAGTFNDRLYYRLNVIQISV